MSNDKEFYELLSKNIEDKFRKEFQRGIDKTIIDDITKKYETAIIKTEIYVVEYYDSTEKAIVGHKSWIDKIQNGTRLILNLDDNKEYSLV